MRTRGLRSAFSNPIPWLVVASLVLAPLPALAQPSAAELAAARDLFEDGLKREEKGDFEGALANFRRVAAVKTTPAVRFHVALCLEKTGHLVDALNEFERALSDVNGDTSAPSATIAKNAGNHVTDLRARIPRLLVRMPDGAEGAVVEIDGTTIVPSLLGIALPYDPGTHVVTARAEGKHPFEQKVELVERGEQVEVAVTLTAEETKSVEKKTVAVETHESPSWPWPFIAAGIGAGAAIGAGVMYYQRSSTIRQLDDTCGLDRTRCPESKSYLEDRGKTYTSAGNVLLGVSAVAFGAAVVLFVTKPGDGETTATATTMGLATDGSTLRWFGRF